MTGMRDVSTFIEIDTLRLIGCSVDEEWMKLVGDMPKLTRLYLTDVVELKDADVNAMCSSSGCQNLEFIKLNYCEVITEASVEALAKRYPRMRRIGLEHCPKIGESVKKMQEKYPKIIFLKP